MRLDIIIHTKFQHTNTYGREKLEREKEEFLLCLEMNMRIL